MQISFTAKPLIFQTKTQVQDFYWGNKAAEGFLLFIILFFFPKNLEQR